MSTTPSTPAAPFVPRHFGDPARPLFGLYHAPQSAARRGTGIVLCYPMGQEYIRAHRSYRQLAQRLATAGFPVLRFDYYGCGDSGGAREDGHLGQWLHDIATAVAELRGCSGAAAVCLVGLRFGAALALLAAANQGDVDGVVLWDPTPDGEAYVRELAAADAARPNRPGSNPRAAQSLTELTEAQGFPLTDRLRTDVLAVRLSEVARRPAPRVLLVESQEPSGTTPLMQRLEALGTRVEHRLLPNLPIWVEQNKALVPIQILQTTVSWLSDTFA